MKNDEQKGLGKGKPEKRSNRERNVVDDLDIRTIYSYMNLLQIMTHIVFNFIRNYYGYSISL